MKKHTQKGFTLIEMVVATGLLAIFLLVFAGIFSSFVTNQRRDSSRQLVLEQLRLALEIMNRELRTAYGTSYTLTDSSGRSIMFRNQNGVCVHIRWRDNALERAEGPSSGSNCPNSNFPASSYAALTSKDVAIEYARFDAIQAENGDSGPTNFPEASLSSQGFVTVILSATDAAQNLSPINLQSTVTSRQVIPYVRR
ncbi:MAG: type II secretion system protein [Candidatus Andersenbacteria bacterium]|nr:type II secretion system protein [Candidatus Andersenbacteria bacterium]